MLLLSATLWPLSVLSNIITFAIGIQNLGHNINNEKNSLILKVKETLAC